MTSFQKKSWTLSPGTMPASTTSLLSVMVWCEELPVTPGMNYPIPPNGKAGKSSTQKWHFNGVYIYIYISSWEGIVFFQGFLGHFIIKPGWFKNGTCMKYVYTYKSCSIGPPSTINCGFWVATQNVAATFLSKPKCSGHSSKVSPSENLRSLMYQNQLALESGNNWTYNNLYTHFASKSQCTTYIPTVTSGNTKWPLEIKFLAASRPSIL